MSMKLVLMASTAFFALNGSVFAADKESYQSTTKIEKDSSGNYSEEKNVSKTEIDGTTNSSNKQLIVRVDANGNTDKKMTSEFIRDPQGSGNKHAVVTKDTEKTKYGMVTTTHEKTVNGKTVEGTNDNYRSASKSERAPNGSFIQKEITTKTEEDGTTVIFEKDATVAVDANGDTDKLTTTKKVTDPLGMMNKSTVKTSNTEKTKDGMVKSTQKVSVDGKTVETKSETVTQ